MKKDHQPTTKLVLFMACVSIGLLTQCGAGTSTDEPSTEPPSTVEENLRDTGEALVQYDHEKDSIHDQTALYIAGMMQHDDNSPYHVLQEKEYWQKFSRTFNQNWSNLMSRRLIKMQRWQRDVFSGMINDTLPLYYPFSGPDFLHAQMFYPDAPSITMFALEQINTLPDFLQMNEKTSKEALAGIEHALRDIYSKSYFITMHMGEDLNFKKASGVLPIFYVFLARTGQEIYQVNRVTLDSSATLVPYDSYEADRKLEAVQILFKERHKDEPLRELVYFKVNIENEQLERHPEFVQYLTGLKPTNTFVKSASYVMHWGSFTRIRDIAIEISASIFQDDTGVRLSHLPSTEWEIQLFGDYRKPIKNFPSSTFQANLKELYEQTPEDEIMDLPFPLGYHVVVNEEQNHMLAKKKKEAL